MRHGATKRGYRLGARTRRVARMGALITCQAAAPVGPRTAAHRRLDLIDHDDQRVVRRCPPLSAASHPSQWLVRASAPSAPPSSPPLPLPRTPNMCQPDGSARLSR